MQFGIYIPEPGARVFRFYVDQLSTLSPDSVIYYSDVDAFIASTAKTKIACFQLPYPYDESLAQDIDTVYPVADHILVLGSELHASTVDFIHRFDRAKIKYFICGRLFPMAQHAAEYKFLDWFISTVAFYKSIKPSLLFNLRPFHPKQFMFDALLGRKKPHRDQAYEYITTNLSAQGIITYMNTHQANLSETNSNRWIWPAEVEYAPIEFTIEKVNYYGHAVNASQIIPINIYNQTAYSLVCETNYDNGFVFFTEKTVKPILARRLFIVIGNRLHLETLRKYGFRTFDGIIDESYDLIESAELRHRAALEQLHWLCQQPQESILAQCHDVVNHNFDLMYGRDWEQLFMKDFAQFFVSQ